MSSNNKKMIATKYCKVCQDAGKSETEYRSHFTRESKDPNSKVLCPTLLALECRYCFKNGHTVKYCKIIKNNEKNKKRWEQEAENKKNIIEKEKYNNEKKKVTNKFAYLEDEDSENELEEHISNNFNKNISEEFPQLTSVPTKNTFGGSNYANALANNVAAPLPASIPVRMTPLTNKKKLSIGEINWADLDSDSDEDEDIYDSVQEAYNNYDQKDCYTYEEDW
jgi:hypothetical protein